jgi:hypothetical protein
MTLIIVLQIPIEKLNVKQREEPITWDKMMNYIIAQ